MTKEVASGELRVASEEWRVAGGLLRVACDEWRVAGGGNKKSAGEGARATLRNPVRAADSLLLRCAAAGRDYAAAALPPILRRELLRLRPHAIERVTFVEFAVLHDIADGGGVADVHERVAIEHDQVGELAGFD